jgi:signal transduction histidine kinase
MTNSAEDKPERCHHPVVLAVDDEARCLALIEAFLLPSGVHVETARSGEEALQIAANIQPDVILLDIMMSGICGFETLRRLKADPLTSRIPVVMVTALGIDVQDRIKALECGADDFLTKPVNRLELELRVRTLAQLKDYHDHMRDHNATLEREVEQRTIALTREMEERRRLELDILDAEAGERRRIGHDLHDGLGQVLTALAMVARGLELDLEEAGRPEAGKASTLSAFADQAKRMVRDLMDGRSLMICDEHDLELALRELANHVETVFGIPCAAHCDAGRMAIGNIARVQIFRIAGEAAFNAAKHAGALSIAISLHREGKRLVLNVRDDGSGMPATSPGTGMGLAIMRHRAELIGATLKVESESGSGTSVTCVIGSEE